MKCKEVASMVIFDAMLWDDDAVILRQSSPDPQQLFIISLDVFANRFDAIGN